MELRRLARLRRAAALALGLLVVGAGALTTPPAAAAEDLLTVAVTSVNVTGTGAEAVVRLQAQVTNAGATEVYGARVGIWRSRDPIEDLSALRQVLGSNPPWGLLLDGSYQKITEQTEPFAPGSTRTVTLSATLGQLGFDTVGSAYTLGVRALGYNPTTGGYDAIGLGRTVIALPETTVPVTRLVVLSASPTKLTDNVFRSEELADQLKGRLDALLTAAAAPGASWLIDPALLDELTDMANGYQVRREGELADGTGSQAAADWLSRFGRLNRSNGARSLFANPDLAGAAAGNDRQVLARALTAGATVTSLADLPVVVLPTGAVYTTETGSYLAGTEAKAVVATNIASAGAWQPGDTLPILAASPELGAAGLDDLQRRQYLQAEAVIAGASGQLWLIREPADLAVATAATAPWMTPRGLSSLLAAAPAGDLAEVEPVGIPILEPDHFEAISDLEQYFAAYGQLVPESTLTDEAAAVLTRAASTAWIDDTDGRRGLMSAIGDLVGPRALARAVTLDASPRFVMSSRTNEFPVTLTNNLDETIQLKVLVDSENPQRLTVPPSELVSIAPGQSETVNIRPEATANGIVQAEAYAVTESGRRVTPDTPITIEITELGFIGWVLVVASGGVVVLTTALRILQVRKKNAAAAAHEAADADTEVLDG